VVIVDRIGEDRLSKRLEFERDMKSNSRMDEFMKERVLDDVDRRLLRALQGDAGLSHVALAELAGSSPASCWRRIRALEEAGILKGAVRLVDAERVGRGVNVMCQVRMRSHAPADRTAFEAYLATRPDVMEAHSMSGEWDYLLLPDVRSAEPSECGDRRLPLRAQPGEIHHRRAALGGSHGSTRPESRDLRLKHDI
jgi:DNA-binding Lrp family transcriptional regulator